MALKKTYFISIDKNACWATQIEEIAIAQARNIARQYGGCEMTVINGETRGGHVTVYGPDGNIKEMKPLCREEESE